VETRCGSERRFVWVNIGGITEEGSTKHDDCFGDWSRHDDLGNDAATTGAPSQDSGRWQAQRQAPRGGSCPTETRTSTTPQPRRHILNTRPLELPTTWLPLADCVSFYCEPHHPMIPYSERISTSFVTRPTSLPPPLSPSCT
jgi:hypothetical protein